VLSLNNNPSFSLIYLKDEKKDLVWCTLLDRQMAVR